MLNRKRELVWYLILFTDEKKAEVLRILRCRTMRELAYYLDMKPQTVSNYFHGLIRARGILHKCGISQYHKTI